MSKLAGSVLVGAFFAILAACSMRLIEWYIAMPCALLCALAIVYVTIVEAPDGHEDEDGFHLD